MENLINEDYEKLSVQEGGQISVWLTQELALVFCASDQSLSNVRGSTQSKSRWAVPETRLSGNELGFVLFQPADSMEPLLTELMKKLQLYLEDMKIDWTVYCYEKRLFGGRKELSITPSRVISKKLLARSAPEFESLQDGNS